MEVVLNVLPKQDDVLRDVTADCSYWDDDAPDPAFKVLYIGGVGSGKTWIGARWLVLLALRNPAGCAYLATAPSYPQTQLYTIPALEAALAELHVPYEFRRQERCFVLPGRTRLWVRSTDDADRLVGGTVAGVWEDEAYQDSDDVMDKLVQRVRDSRAELRQMLLTSTPEGTRTALYAEELRAERGDPSVRLVRATTFENTHNPTDYLDALKRQYDDDPAGLRQYLMGMATDRSGNIYTRFSPANVAECTTPHDSAQIVLGWDFNVHWMATPICLWWPHLRLLHVVSEVVTRSHNGTTTAEHARLVVDKLDDLRLIQMHDGRVVHNISGDPVAAYIDASGAAKHSSATWSDEAAVRSAGFQPRHEGANPLWRNRLAAMQQALGEVRVLISAKGAPVTLRSVREHAYDKWGQPEKRWNLEHEVFQADHACDALGYVVWGLMPVRVSRRGSAGPVLRKKEAGHAERSAVGVRVF